MTTPSKDDVLRVAQECGAMTGTGSIQFRLDGSLERFAAAMYSAGIESAKADVLRVAGEPVATLRVEMHTHDMGQSLAPNPPFKAAIAHARTIAGTYPLGVYKLYTESQLLAMYAAGQESAKAEGWRQCAVGQHTSQFCGQAEAVVAAEREIDEELALAESLIAKISGSALLAGEKCHKDDSALLYKIACDALVTVAYARSLLSALPITPTNTEGEQG